MIAQRIDLVFKASPYSVYNKTLKRAIYSQQNMDVKQY